MNIKDIIPLSICMIHHHFLCAGGVRCRVRLVS